jgi:hypothetical protein
MPLGCFCPTVNNLVTMVHNPNSMLSKVHVTILNFNNFKMIEAMGLKLSLQGPLEWHHLPSKFH